MSYTSICVAVSVSEETALHWQGGIPRTFQLAYQCPASASNKVSPIFS